MRSGTSEGSNDRLFTRDCYTCQSRRTGPSTSAPQEATDPMGSQTTKAVILIHVATIYIRKVTSCILVVKNDNMPCPHGQ